MKMPYLSSLKLKHRSYIPKFSSMSTQYAANTSTILWTKYSPNLANHSLYEKYLYF